MGYPKDARYFSVGGEICHNCNETYKTIYRAPDDLWIVVDFYALGALTNWQA